jgi:hypothetical protein
MSGAAHRAIITIAALLGALVPFRALLFTSRTDPATEAIDLVLCPIYIVGRFLPPMGDVGSLGFFIVVLVVNAALYGSVAHYLVRKFFTAEPPTLRGQQRG